MNNEQNNFEELSNSLIDFINGFMPKKEEIEIIQNKLKNNEKLSLNDNFVLDKVKIINCMFKNIKR